MFAMVICGGGDRCLGANVRSGLSPAGLSVPVLASTCV